MIKEVRGSLVPKEHFLLDFTGVGVDCGGVWVGGEGMGLMRDHNK